MGKQEYFFQTGLNNGSIETHHNQTVDKPGHSVNKFLRKILKHTCWTNRQD